MMVGVRAARQMHKLEKQVGKGLDSLEKKAGSAWDSVTSELEPEPEPQQEAGCAYTDGGEASQWEVLVDRTVRAYPGESSKKLGTIR